MKDGMSGILQQIRLGRVRKARKSSIIQPPLLSMSIFRNSEKNRQNGFRKNDLPRKLSYRLIEP